MGRLFICGDTHGTIEMHKLSARAWPMGVELTREDYVLVLGDFGLPWSGNDEDLWWLEWLEDKPWTTLFVDGNHENFDLLGALPIEEWNGGRIQRVRQNVLHLMRGDVFDLCGMSCFAMGGATSIDRVYRTPGRSWWPEEMPSAAEMNHALAVLDTRGWEVDCVFTHCAPANVLHEIGQTFANDALTEFLFDVERRLRFELWALGHYHDDRAIGDKHLLTYNRIWEVSKVDGNVHWGCVRDINW